MRRGQANALAVALGVSLIIVLLLSACYMLSSITVRTTKTLELLSEQARAVMYINGSGYLVGNTRPEYIVVKDPSGNIEVYLANSLGVELNKKFPQLSGIVYGVAGNGAVRQLKPAPWLNFTNANKYLSTVTVWPGWIYTYRAIAPINNTSWVNVTASNERELVAESGYLNATGSSKLRLVATVNYTVTSIFGRYGEYYSMTHSGPVTSTLLLFSQHQATQSSASTVIEASHSTCTGVIRLVVRYWEATASSRLRGPT